jgi:hypothetical protein
MALTELLGVHGLASKGGSTFAKATAGHGAISYIQSEHLNTSSFAQSYGGTKTSELPTSRSVQANLESIAAVRYDV